MIRTHAQVEASQQANTPRLTLGALLSQSENDFYGQLQRTWNSVSQHEDVSSVPMYKQISSSMNIDLPEQDSTGPGLQWFQSLLQRFSEQLPKRRMVQRLQ